MRKNTLDRRQISQITAARCAILELPTRERLGFFCLGQEPLAGCGGFFPMIYNCALTASAHGRREKMKSRIFRGPRISIKTNAKNGARFWDPRAAITPSQ